MTAFAKLLSEINIAILGHAAANRIGSLLALSRTWRAVRDVLNTHASVTMNLTDASTLAYAAMLVRVYKEKRFAIFSAGSTREFPVFAGWRVLKKLERSVESEKAPSN